MQNDSIPEDPVAADDVKEIYARVVKYKLGEEDCEILGYALSDGDVQFEIHRAGRVYPVRLSRVGQQAIMALIQDIFWNAPAAGKKS